MGVKSYLLLKHMNEKEGHCGCKTSIFKMVFPVKIALVCVMDANIGMWVCMYNIGRYCVYNCKISRSPIYKNVADLLNFHVFLKTVLR